MRHDAVEQYVRSHVVIKRNKRLMIQCIETGEVVYTPPDFLRPFIHNRDKLNVLAARLNREWIVPIPSIIDFETSLRPGSP